MVHSPLSADTIEAAEQHLSQSCTVMARLVASHDRFPIVDRDFSPFQTLASSIMGQQLSVKAAATIKNRVMGVIPHFTPGGFRSVPFDVLRSAGLSKAKATYILGLADAASDGQIDLDALSMLSDDDVIEVLIALPGIGRWTAEMFLMFGLKRPNILALGDAGLRRSARLLYGTEVELEALGNLWRPYRSVASWYLWQHLDAAPQSI